MSNPEPLLASTSLLQQAEQACLQRLARDPENRSALVNLAQVYRKLGNLEQATAAYQRLCHLDPDNEHAQYVHAMLSGAEPPELPDGRRPAPFVLMKHFLPADFHDTLLPFAHSVQDKLVPAAVSNGDDGKEYDPQTRESLDLPGVWDVKARFRQFIRDVIPSAMSRLQVAPFEIGELEVKVRAYLDGHFFRMHMDCPPGTGKIAYRKISYVYFFHKVPRAYSGGDLLLFDTDIAANRYTTSGFTRIVPEDNTLVLFPSPYFHSVVPVICPSKVYADSRFVINGHVSSPRPAVSEDGPAKVSAAGDREPEPQSTGIAE